MVPADVDDRVELVARRVGVLEALCDAPRHKPALVESLGHSRSTVDRAIRELVDEGFVERTDEGFRTTLAGRFAAERYRSFLTEMAAIVEGTGVLRALPADCGLPFAAVTESRVEPVESPARAFEAVVEPLRTADQYVAFLPRLDDSRHLRLCHARVRDGMAAELLVAPEVLERLRTEFPRLAADLARSDDVAVRRVEASRPYALCLAHSDRSTVSIAPVADGATAVFVSAAPSAVGWAESALADLRAAATDATDDLAALVEALDETPLGRHERRGPSDLAGIGFQRLDAAALSRRTPNDPATGWRVGFDLVDVYYGHPFERHHLGTDDRVETDAATGIGVGDAPPDEIRPRPADAADGPSRFDADDGPSRFDADDGSSHADADDAHRRPADAADEVARAVDHLDGALADGTHTVVLGPPGSGKSTLCRQVACRWIAAGRGPVFYRETPVDAAFDRSGVLTSALDETDEHALVVVEDGGDESTASGLATVLERARDDPGVSVLVEARTTDWPPAPSGSRETDLLRSGLAEYHLGRVSSAECRDAVAVFEAATGRDVPCSADELFETVRAGDGPGDCHLLGHLLVAHATPEPWSDGATAPTGLDADARAGYATVAPGGPDDDTVPL